MIVPIGFAIVVACAGVVVVAAMWTVRDALRRVVARVGHGRLIVRAGILAVEILSLVIVIPTVVTFVLELDDRRTERRLRAWEIILEIGNQVGEPVASGSAARDALRVLNHEYAGRFCGTVVRRLSEFLGGDRNRRCLIPAIERDRLTGVRLPYVDLTGIDLENAILRGADLRETTLDTARLGDTEFTGAALNGARLNRTDMRDAILNGADLAGAQLTLADLGNTQLNGAPEELGIVRTQSLERRQQAGVSDGGGVILDDASLMFASLADARMYNSSLRNANLVGADLADAELGAADVTGALVLLADFSGAAVRGVRGLEQEMLDSTCIAPDQDIRRGGATSDLVIDAATKQYEVCRAMIRDPQKQRRLLEWISQLDLEGLYLRNFASVFPFPTTILEWMRGDSVGLSEDEVMVFRERVCADPAAVMEGGRSRMGRAECMRRLEGIRPPP